MLGSQDLLCYDQLGVLCQAGLPWQVGQVCAYAQCVQPWLTLCSTIEQVMNACRHSEPHQRPDGVPKGVKLMPKGWSWLCLLPPICNRLVITSQPIKDVEFEPSETHFWCTPSICLWRLLQPTRRWWWRVIWVVGLEDGDGHLHEEGLHIGDACVLRASLRALLYVYVLA